MTLVHDDSHLVMTLAEDAERGEALDVVPVGEGGKGRNDKGMRSRRHKHKHLSTSDTG